MSAAPGNARLDILLVEDNPADVRLIREALREAQLQSSLHLAADGVEALAYLRREGRFADAPRPDLILLDLNLPRKDGREVLEEIKEDPELRRIPVVVLSSSEARQDVGRTYDLHANCYVTKPVELDEFLRTTRSVVEFWSSVVTLPPPP